MITTVDVETSTKNKGNPFTKGNLLVNVGLRSNQTTTIKYYDDKDFKKHVQEQLNKSSMLIGFNIKFDLHWLRNGNFDFSHCRIWDCQLAHFILTGQREPYPSLNSVANHYGLGSKLDVVSEQYWDKGIDTQNIPREVLSDYLEQDLLLTERVYLKQVEDFAQNHPPETLTLFKLQCLDLLVLQEMEYNGMWFDVEESEMLAEQEERAINQIEAKLNETTEVPINWGSRDHLSCYLYGGSIIIKERLPVGVYKTGAKIGQQRY